MLDLQYNKQIFVQIQIIMLLSPMITTVPDLFNFLKFKPHLLSTFLKHMLMLVVQVQKTEVSIQHLQEELQTIVIPGHHQTVELDLVHPLLIKLQFLEGHIM